MSSTSSSDTSAPVRLTGRVKWFNNKTGFGFISVVGGNDQFKDASEIFVHHSAVTVSQEQYRYLVEGEYVEFSVVVTDSGEHKFQAGDVRGVKGGKLFCETRHEHRASHDGGDGGDGVERGRPQVRGRGQGYSGGRGGSSVGRGGRVDGGGRGGSSGGRGGRVDGGSRGGHADGGGRGGSEWMLVRRDRNEQSDSRGYGHSRGRSEDYSDRVRFLKPVRFGDTITTLYKVSSIDPVKKKIISEVTCTNQNGELVAVATNIRVHIG